MSIEKIIHTVAKEIENFPKEQKMLIGIEGYSGSGKTTLLNALAENIPGILTIHRDDFMCPRECVKSLFLNSKDRARTLRYDAIDKDTFIDLLRQYKKSDELYSLHVYNPETGKVNVPKVYDLSKRVAIVEGIFLLHPQFYPEMYDYKVVLSCDLEEADERRRKREKARWGDAYFPDTHPDSYFRYIRIGYEGYLKKYSPEKAANLVLKV